MISNVDINIKTFTGTFCFTYFDGEGMPIPVEMKWPIGTVPKGVSDQDIETIKSEIASYIRLAISEMRKHQTDLRTLAVVKLQAFAVSQAPNIVYAVMLEADVKPNVDAYMLDGNEQHLIDAINGAPEWFDKTRALALMGWES